MVSELLSRGPWSGQQSWRAIVRREEPGRNWKPGTRPRVYREQQQPVLRAYVTYYERSRTHLALGKDTPEAHRSGQLGANRGAARSRRPPPSLRTARRLSRL